MISRQPLMAAAEAAGIADKIRAYVTAVRAKAADGLTVAEFAEIVTSAMRLAIQSLDYFDGLGNDQKKQIVLDFVGDLFDEFADRLVPLYLWPIWLVSRSAIRLLVLSVASGAVEALLPLVRLAEDA